MKLKSRLALNIYGWLWVAIESNIREILQIDISLELNMFVVKHFISSLINRYGQNPVSTDSGTWYPHQAYKFIKIEHHIHSSCEKSKIERTMQYIKDRTECFDDYFPCRKKNCKLKHVQQWLNLFAYHYNKEFVS